MTVKLVRVQLSGFSAIRRMREIFSEESPETTESAFTKKHLYVNYLNSDKRGECNITCVRNEPK